MRSQKGNANGEERTDARGIVCNPKRVRGAERCAVAGAGRPPVSSGVYHGIPVITVTRGMSITLT
jgi:hypothetical protein